MVCIPSCFRGPKLLKELRHPLPPPPLTSPPLQNDNKASLLLCTFSQEENAKQEEELLQKPSHPPTFPEPLINLGEKTSNSSRKKVTFDLSANTDAKDEQGRKGEETSESSMDPFLLTISCCPLNNSHGQNKNVQDNLIEQESSESLFSLSIDSRKQDYAYVSADDGVENEVESPMPFSKNSSIIVSGKETTEKATGSARDVCSVLNPIENITHWKEVKATAAMSQSQSLEHEAKENVRIMSTRVDRGPTLTPISKRKHNGVKQVEEVVGVDTSLSSWLAESKGSSRLADECSSTSTDSVANSPAMINRPTPGRLKKEEIGLRSFSVCVSPRRSTSGSPEEKPVVGTVGSYWSCTGQSQS